MHWRIPNGWGSVILILCLAFWSVVGSAGCSQARRIAQKAEQASEYKKQAVQQLKELTAKAASWHWTELKEQRSIDVRLHTTKGSIDIRLAFQLAPLACASFLFLADALGHSGGGYIGASFSRPQGGAANVRASSKVIFPALPVEFSEWLDFHRPGTVAFDGIAATVFNPSSFFITLQSSASQRDLFGRFTAFGQLIKGLNVAQKLRNEDQILSTEIYSNDEEGQEFLAQLRREGLAMLQGLRAKMRYQRQGIAAIHQKLARDFATVHWPRHQTQELQQPPNSNNGAPLAKDATNGWARDWGLEYKVLQEGTGQQKIREKLADGNTNRALIQYAVWATQDDGRSLLLEDRIQKQQSIWVAPEQLFPAWRAALLDMKPGEKRLYVLPPEGAYGIKGKPPDIPPWSYLVMELYAQ